MLSTKHYTYCDALPNTCCLLVPSNGDKNAPVLFCATEIESTGGTWAPSAAGQACNQILV